LPKILFLFSNFHQRAFTGQSGTVWQLAQSLSERFEVHVISNTDSDAEKNIEGPIHLWLFKSAGDPTPQYLLRLPRFIARIFSLKPDVIHVHGLPFIVYASLLSRVTQTPFVCSFNEDITLRPPWLQRLIARSINRSEGVFVSCEYYRGRLLKLNVRPEKIHVAPFGLKMDFLKNQLFAAAEPYDVVYVGDSRKSRGFDVVCRMAEAMPEHSFLMLIRWFMPSGKTDCEIARQLPNVKLLEYPYAKPLFELIQSAKIVALPFRSTSPILPPMTLVESMGLGKCALTTRLPGTEELCDDAKSICLVDLNDIPGLVSLARRLIRDEKERRSIGQNARQKIQSMFLEQYAPFLSFYSDMLAS